MYADCWLIGVYPDTNVTNTSIDHKNQMPMDCMYENKKRLKTAATEGSSIE